MANTQYLDLAGLTYYDSKIKEYIDNGDLKNKVLSSDKTVTIKHPGDSEYSDPSTDLSVNIDGTTIIKNATTGKLSVASSALTQYVGDKAIVIGNTDANNQKTVSLKINSADKLLSQTSDGLSATIQLAKLSESATAALGSNVLEAYGLVGKDGNVLSNDPTQIVKIYKDSSLVNLQVGHVGAVIDSSDGSITDGNGADALILVYLLADGTYSGAVFNVSTLLSEAEFKNGLQVTNGEVSVKVDAATEADSAGKKYLSVSASGVKVANINGEIATKINALGTITAATNKFWKKIKVQNGKLTGTEAALPTVIKGTDGSYFTTTVSGTYDKTISGAVTVQSVSTSGTSAKGLAEASDVKSYVDNAVSEGIGSIESITNSDINKLF